MDIENLVNNIMQLVENECKKDSNAFGYGIWSHHIVYVVKFGRILAEKLGADKEIVEISAILHDLAGIMNKEIHDQHHLYGAQEAERILSGYGYPSERIEKVKGCILAHRGSVDSERLSPEEICVASADAMAHIDQMVSLLYYVYHKDGLDIEDGKQWVRNKLVRSWNKLCPEAKEMMKEKYLSALNVLQSQKLNPDFESEPTPDALSSLRGRPEGGGEFNRAPGG